MIQEQTLQALLTERVSIFAAGERPKAIIDDHVEKMFKSVIEDCFRKYGDLSNVVSESIKAAMPGNISGVFELTRYNALVESSLRQQWESSGIEGEMVKRANAALTEALKDTQLPAVVSLRGLLEAFADHNKEDARSEGWETPEVRFTESKYGGLSVYFDKMPEEAYAASAGSYGASKRRSEYSLENRVHIGWDQRSPEKDAEGRYIGKVWGAVIDGDPIGKKFVISTPLERVLAALYFGAAKIVVDCDPDDITYDVDD